jgi:hypothetical protein
MSLQTFVKKIYHTPLFSSFEWFFVLLFHHRRTWFNHTNKINTFSVTKSEERSHLELACVIHKLKIIITSGFYCFHMEQQATYKGPQLRCVEIYTTPNTRLRRPLTHRQLSSRLYCNQNNNVSSIQPSIFLQEEYHGFYSQVSFPVSIEMLLPLIPRNEENTKRWTKWHFLSHPLCEKQSQICTAGHWVSDFMEPVL